MEKRVRTMLEKAVGAGKAIVRVSALIDFKQEQRTEELYDPEGQVARSEQRNDEKTVGATLPAGVAGVQGNLPESTAVAMPNGKPAETEKSNRTVNYEINKVVKTIFEPGAQVKKLSVAVMVDGKYKEVKGQDGKVSRDFQHISAEEKTTLQNLVRTAIGFDANRQDVVTVESMQFDEAPVSEEAQILNAEAQKEFALALTKYAGLGIAGAVLFFFLLRPLMKAVGRTDLEAEELKALPLMMAKMEEDINKLGAKKEEKKEGADVDYRKRLSEVIAANPQQAAELVRSWIRKAKT